MIFIITINNNIRYSHNTNDNDYYKNSDNNNVLLVVIPIHLFFSNKSVILSKGYLQKYRWIYENISPNLLKVFNDFHSEWWNLHKLLMNSCVRKICHIRTVWKMIFLLIYLDRVLNKCETKCPCFIEIQESSRQNKLLWKNNEIWADYRPTLPTRS